MLAAKKQTLKRLLWLALGIINVAVLFSLVTVSPVRATPIPDGCPGSANPQNPPPQICSTIPIGCPGSSLQGPPAQPPTNCPYEAGSTTLNTGDTQGAYQCGIGDGAVHTSIDLGCKGNPCVDPHSTDPLCAKDSNGNYVHPINGILDALFAIIRFLSIGVGLVVIGSIIMAGIQYTTSRGDPSATAKALERVRNTLIALAIYIFMYAIINFLVPGKLL